MALKSNIPMFQDRLQAAVQRALTTAAGIVRDDADNNAPFDTGTLAGSIHERIEPNRAIVSTNMEYAAYQEYGTGLFAENGQGRKTGWFYEDENGKGHWTRGNRPHPFMRPALNKNTTLIKSIIAKEIEKATKGVTPK